jgi:hypothetical protein
VNARSLRAVLALAAFTLFAAAGARAADAVRVQAEGVAPLPPFVPGSPAAKPPSAEALRALRQTAVDDGVEVAVLAQASELAREDIRDDETALRAALGALPDYALGFGVLADLGAREAKPRPGDPPARARRPKDPVPMEHAWRIEALVDRARVSAALQAAGLALTSSADSGAVVRIVLEAPHDAAGLAALRARLVALGAQSVVPRRFSASETVLVARGVQPEVIRQRIVSQPPAGFMAAASASEETPDEIRIRLTPAAR